MDHHAVKNRLSRDPDVVYLMEFGVPMMNRVDLGRTSPYDALLCFNGISHKLEWHSSTKASIRKMLQESHQQYECAICYETIKPLQGCICPQCGCKTCALCRTKMGLTADTIRKVKGGDFGVIGKCVECRVLSTVDARTLRPQV